MTTITQKTVHELTSDERAQISNLLEQFYPNSTQEYIDNRVLIDNKFDIVIAKENENILAVSYYKYVEIKSPFSKKKLPVIHFAQALKKSETKSGAIMNLGTPYVIKKLGYNYMFREALGITCIIAPKVYEKFVKNADEFYPNHEKPNQLNQEILTCLNNFFDSHREINIHIDDSCCFDYKGVPGEDITKNWDRYYKSKNPAINQYFVDKGIIYFKNDRVYKTSKHLVAIAYRHPIKFLLKNIFRRSVNPLKKEKNIIFKQH